MFNYKKINDIILYEKPDYIICEKESINIDLIKDLENQNFNIIPNSKSVEICMSRELLRDFVSDLNILTSKYAYCTNNFNEFKCNLEKIGLPCVVKPCFSSSGKGQSIINNESQIENAFKNLNQARGNCNKIIIEEFIDFDFEVTMLTVKQNANIYFCPPIIHKQKKGDFYLSYQHNNILKSETLIKSQNICKKIVNELGGNGIFGVELFIKGDEVIFNEVAPRVHDTGILTLKTQNYSEFDLLLYSIYNINIGDIKLLSPGISYALNYYNNTSNDIYDYKINFDNKKIYINDTIYYYHFNKPVIEKNSRRRIGIVILLLNDKDIDENYLQKKVEYLQQLCIDYRI